MRSSAAWSWAPIVVALGLVSSCAKRTDERVRRAWGSASKAPAVGAGDRTGPDQNPDAETKAEPIRVGWERLEEIVDTALVETNVGTDDEMMARLAERWCQVQPVPKGTDDGPVFVCAPNPPLQIDGHAFTLELGGEGVIGLVSVDLSPEDSSALANEALRRTERWCTRPWTDLNPRPTADSTPPPKPADQLYTCPVEGSALLVVARFVSNEETGGWQVSVAVIDAS